MVYVYAESVIARQNLEFFLQKGLHGKADFVFIFNGETNASDMVPRLDHVQVVKRTNTCFDLGAAGEILRKDSLWQKYKRFVVMNASVRGPFFPTCMKPCWTDMFLGTASRTAQRYQNPALQLAYIYLSPCIPPPPGFLIAYQTPNRLIPGFVTDDLSCSSWPA